MSDKLGIGYLNIYHLYNKIHEINIQLNRSKYTTHILGLSETKLHENITDEDINIPNYTLIRKDKTKQYEHGLIAYVHSSISKSIKRRSDLEHREIESLWVEICQEKSKPKLLCFLYRRPDPSKLSEWIDCFCEMIENIPHKNYEIQILGDFNINLNESQKTWNACVAALGLDQLITNFTRVTNTSSTIIDHIYTNVKNKISNVQVINVNKSDHFLIYCEYSQQVPKIPNNGHTVITYRSYKHFNENEFYKSLAKSPFDNVLSTTDPNKAMTIIYELLLWVVNKHAPLRTIRIKCSDIPPWLSHETIAAMNVRDSINKKTQKAAFKSQKNLVNDLVKNDKRNLFNKMIENNKDTKTIWKAMNVLTNKSKKKSNPKTDLPPNEINDYFLNLSKTLLTPEHREKSKNYVCPIELEQFCNKQNPCNSFSIPLMTTSDVYKLVNSLKNSKSLGPDEIPVYLLKLALPFITNALTYAYNLCISQNIFPSPLKEAKVIPIPKCKDTSDPKNFRPISLLPVLTKPLEKHIYYHMYKYMEENNLFTKNQSGFRENHSCHTALVKMIDSCLHAINKSEFTGIVFLDFKKAFDLVNHHILLEKLKLYFPNSTTVDFIRSYLSERQQYTCIDGKKSEKGQILSGVPQGSVLGPLFFLIYINDLPLQLDNSINIDLFADDTSIYASGPNINSINTTLQYNMNKANNWCKTNDMIIHPDKTKSMIIATRQKQQKTTQKLNLTLESSTIEQVKQHKMLGLWIDSGVSWNLHIDKLIKKISRNTFLLSRLKLFTNTHNLKMFFNAHIMSHINYASTIWDGCCKDALKKLNSVYRRAIKHLIHNPNLSTDEKIEELNLLPLDKQLEVNKTIFIQKIICGKTPPYLSQLIKKATPRYNSKNLIPPCSFNDCFKTSLAFSGSIVWNKLPLYLKNISSPKLFKKELYKHYINSVKPP